MVSRVAERIADSPICTLCRAVMTCIAVLQEDAVSNATFLLRYLEGTQKMEENVLA
jgi:ferredoxin